MLRVLTSVDYSGRFIWLLRSWVGASARLCIFLIRPSSLFVGFCAFKSTVGVSPNELKMMCEYSKGAFEGNELFFPFIIYYRNCSVFIYNDETLESQKTQETRFFAF